MIATRETKRRMVVDIGGEGRHAVAWNVNPSSVKTVGPNKGDPIPRHLFGRADAIPLKDGSADAIIVERTPLTRKALKEIRRVIAPGGMVVLRHASMPHLDPHRIARETLPGTWRTKRKRIGNGVIQQTRFRLPRAVAPIRRKESRGQN